MDKSSQQINKNILKTVQSSNDLVSYFKPHSKFDNPISGQVFEGKTLEEYISFVNPLLSYVIIKESRLSMNIRLAASLLGDKFIIRPCELKNIVNIISLHFIKKKILFIKKKEKLSKICLELSDISFDYNIFFSCYTQSGKDWNGPRNKSVCDDFQSLVNLRTFENAYVNFIPCRVFDLKTSIFNFLDMNIVPEDRYVVNLEVSDFKNCDISRFIFEYFSTKEANWHQFYLGSRLQSIQEHFLKVINPDNVWTQSGGRSRGDAYIIPTVAQGFFDFNTKNTHDFSEDAQKILSSFTSSLSTIASGSATNKLGDIFNTLINCVTGGFKIRFEGLDEVLSRLDSLVDFGKNLVIAILILIVLRSLARLGLISDFVLSLVSSFLCLAGIAKIVGEDTWKSIWTHVKDCYDYFTYDSYIVCQASMASTSSSIEVFMIMLQTITLGKSLYFGKDLISSFISSTRNWDKMKVDFSENINSWFTISQSFLNYVAEKFAFKPWTIWEGKYPELYRVMDTAQTFVDELVKNPVMTFDKGRKLESILRSLRECQKELPNSAVHERNILRSVSDSLTPWKIKMGKANFLGNGPRVKPAGVLFTGPSQIGKSEWNNVFCRLIAARCLNIERLESFLLNPSSEVYNRIIEQEYWDAWADQSVVQFDEIGARRDMIGANNEAFESMRIINGNPYGLHAADVESKGMINARPILVSGTSNMISFDWTSLTFQQAFENRYTAYAVIPKVEYRVNPEANPFDFEKCKMKPLDEWLDDFGHLEFWEYDLTKARKEGSIFQAIISKKPLSAMEIKELYVEKINKNIKFGAQILSMHDEMIKREVLLRDDQKVDNLLESVDETIKKESIKFDKPPEAILSSKIAEELQKIFCQGYKDKSKEAIKMYYQIISVSASLFFGYYYLRELIYPKNCTIKDNKFEIKREFDFGGEVEFVGDNIKKHIDIAFKTGKYLKKNGPVFIQAATDSAKKVFGCGDCIVCKAHSISVDELLIPGKSDHLWPEDSSHIKEKFDKHIFAGDFDLNLSQSLFKDTVPWCLRLRKDVWTEDNHVIKFENSELYAFLVRNYLEQVHLEMAKLSSRKIKALAMEAFNVPRKTMFCFVKNWKIVGAVLAATSVIAVSIYKVFTKIFPQSGTSRSGKGKGKQKIKPKITKIMNKGEQQAATDGVVDNVMNKVLTRCQFRLGHMQQQRPVGVITMLGSGVGIMPMHFAQMLTCAHDEADSNPWLVPALNGDLSQRREIPFEEFQWYSSTEDEISRDIIFFYISPRWLEPTPNLLKYFVKTDSIPTQRFQGALYVPRVVGKNVMIMKEPGFILPNVEVVYNDTEYSAESFHLVDAFKYYFRTEDGDCGSLLVQYSHDGSPARILGMHVSGNCYGTGYSQSLAAEEINMMYDEILNIHNPVVRDVETLEGPFVEATIQGFVNLGVVKGPRTPKTTKIIASPLHNVVFPCETKTARLAPFYVDGVKIDPMENSRMTYQSPSVAISPEMLKCVVNSTVQVIFNRSVIFENICGPRVLTFDEATFGIDGQEFICGVKRSTSAGYPRCMEANLFPGTKRKWLGPVSVDQDKPDALDKDFVSVKKEVEILLEKASRGIRTLQYAQDFPKDERRSKEKVALGLTRGISGTSMGYCIACIMHFGALCEWLMSNRIYNGFTVGINALGEEWATLAKEMKMTDKNRKNYLDGDFKAFDGSHTRQLLYSILDLADAYYGNKSVIREVLLEDLMNSVHIIDGAVYIWNKALPSGHFLTPIINCWINLLLHRCAFIKSYQRKSLENKQKDFSYVLDLYNNNVITEVYGDDNMHFVADAVKEFFNMRDHTDSMLELGYVYTDARKTGNIGDFLTYTEISFLKREFQYSPVLKRICAPLAIKTIKDMIQWKKKKDLSFEDFKKTVEKALLELAFHDEDVFRDLSEKIIFSCRSILFWSPNCISYRSCCLANASREEYL